MPFNRCFGLKYKQVTPLTQHSKGAGGMPKAAPAGWEWVEKTVEGVNAY